MLYITTNKIKHSTVGSSFTVSFSVAPDEVWYLQKLYDSFHTMNMCGIPLTLHKTDYYVAKVEDEPQTETQTETQNSNLTFEKDECAKEYEELGLKELKELIEADRKTENSSEKPNNSTISKMEQVETMSCQECKHFHENAVMYLDQCDFCFQVCKYEPKDEPQTDCAWR